ncbi:hypothetical protein ACFQFC_01740 [Amorphoplanes digitatis]|uniref:Uncharacterized protein n=1 Tax=Actinoplanes digitatis TaxID=1868 RepID=A0A7W7HY19_9ACTN|nr:hypothetical protein [Actinoplanes digitatis]MBB4762898.1 hypothetical protein [Actinoplanes digitatis]BFE71846.1 hypothetical protein GCM10020092_051470 [Actinoplanes digitatis]GID91607.1 hypothetical protein Adi01nite_10190 [Actinoplanes digitatis]
MIDDSLMDQILEAVTGLAEDVAEQILDLVTDVAAELGELTHEDVVNLVEAAITATAGAAATATLHHHRGRVI